VTKTLDILTNAHLVRPFLIHQEHSNIRAKVRIHCIERGDPRQAASESSHDRSVCDPLLSGIARVFWVSDFYLDVALLKLEYLEQKEISDIRDLLQPLEISQSGMAPLIPGERVFVLGYAVFEPGEFVWPSVSSGILSKVISLHGKPVILESSAPVHRGNSGGLLMSRTGQFLGMVTCNIKFKGSLLSDEECHHVQETILPKLNFSIPVSELKQIFDYVQLSSSNEKPLFTVTEEHNKEMQALWDLKYLSLKEEKDFHASFGNKFSEFLLSQAKL